MLWRMMAYEALVSSRVRDTPLLAGGNLRLIGRRACPQGGSRCGHAFYLSRVSALLTADGRSQLASPLAPWSHRTPHSDPPASYGSRLPGWPRSAQIHLRHSDG